MLTLLTFSKGFGLFSLSPFCVKAAYLLQASGQKWQREDLIEPSEMPHRKLPVLRTDDGLIGDSEAIRGWLESKGADFDPGLSDLQKAWSRGLIRMADEHLYFHLVMDRWGNDEGWPTIRDQLFGAIPEPARSPVADGIRAGLLTGLETQGIARFSSQERLETIERDLQAITTIVGQSPFLFGDQPTAADMSVAPVLAAISATPVQTALVKRVANDAVLSEYMTRMTQAIPLP